MTMCSSATAARESVSSHVAVNDLDKSISFYSAMFGEQPTVVKPGYAK